MKFWLYLLAGLALFIGLFWVLAVAVGLLQYLIWAIVLGAVLTVAAGFLLRPRTLTHHSSRRSGLTQRGKAERELKRLEKQQAREKAR